jgi:arylsulfatase A-like enzyme
VSLVDVYPTFCDLAGREAPAEAAGISLMPAVRGERLPPDREVFSEIAWRPDWQGCMVRREIWKYCWYLDGAAELYDLEADPGEHSNLADDAAARAIRDDLHRRLVEFWRPDEQNGRRQALPRLSDNKGAHVAMQYCLPDGAWVDAWP